MKQQPFFAKQGSKQRILQSCLMLLASDIIVFSITPALISALSAYVALPLLFIALVLGILILGRGSESKLDTVTLVFATLVAAFTVTLVYAVTLQRQSDSQAGLWWIITFGWALLVGLFFWIVSLHNRGKQISNDAIAISQEEPRSNSSLKH